MRGSSTRDALDGAITAIGAAGCETPRLDAELLLAHVRLQARERLIVDSDLVAKGRAVRAFQNAVRHRAIEREPVAYILAHRGFRRLDLAVDDRALIPRPETELLVEVGLTLPRGARVLDLGTGSGAVALALKDERPDLLLTGSDLSEDALELARLNGKELGLRSNGCARPPRRPTSSTRSSNPPYVAESARGSLAPEIPATSLPLFGGWTGSPRSVRCFAWCGSPIARVAAVAPRPARGRPRWRSLRAPPASPRCASN